VTEQNGNAEEQQPQPKPPDDGITKHDASVVDARTAKEGALYDPLVESKDEDAFVDPSKIAEHLDRENEAAHAAADTVAPYELLSNPSLQKLAGEYHQDVQAMVRDGGVEAVAAEAIFHYVAGEHAEAAEFDRVHTVLATGEIPGVKLNNPATTIAYLKRTYGSMADTIVENAQKAFRSLPADIQAYLDHDNGDGQLLTNSPHLLVALALHQSGYTKLTPEQAEKEIAHLQKGKMDALGLAKLKIARHVASRGKNREHQGLTQALKDKKNPPKTVAVSKIDARIKQIRLDPHYHDRSSNPSLHKALVSEMAELYAQKSGGR